MVVYRLLSYPLGNACACSSPVVTVSEILKLGCGDVPERSRGWTRTHIFGSDSRAYESELRSVLGYSAVVYKVRFSAFSWSAAERRT